MKPSETLIVFRRLANADGDQSMVEDLFAVFSNPLRFVVLAIFAIVLSFLPTTRMCWNRDKQVTVHPSRTSFLVLIAAVGVLHAMDFQVLPATTFTTTTKNNNKPYHNFSTFYQEAYLDAHVTTASRLSHFFLASSVVALWVWDTRLGVASIAALLVGAISTVPLLATSQPWLEMTLVLMTGMAVTHVCCGNITTSTTTRMMMMMRWLSFFHIWAILDYLDHCFLGHNGSVAIYLGQHYISWALLGQLQLAFTVFRSWVMGK